MSDLAISVVASGPLEDVVQRVTEAIKPAGFGILTRIDFDKKMKEKLGAEIKPCVILGACNPALAYEAYQQTSDVALLIPCNIVLTDMTDGKVRIEAMRPTQMLSVLPAVQSGEAVTKAENELKRCLSSVS